MKKTPLYERHLSLNARMVEFAGFEMPVLYSGIKDEYLAVRNHCGVFDISHMYPLQITSENDEEALNFLNHLTCRSISTLKPGKVQYNAVPSSDGGLLDDITVYKLPDKGFMLLVNSANSEKILTHLKSWQEKKFPGVSIAPYENYILLALQGKDSEAHLKKVISEQEADFSGLYFYEFTLFNGFDRPYFLSRTGYTGEDGFEILLPAEQGLAVWDKLIASGVVPCGLGSRDTLRMEVFYPLYGNELAEDRTPLESSLDWIVSSKKDYLGKENIFSKQVQRKVAGFKMKEKGALPRSHYPVVDAAGQTIGEVTSGGFSFLWDRGFGMAFMDIAYCEDNKSIFIDIRGKKNEAVVYVKSPYKGSIKRRSK